MYRTFRKTEWHWASMSYDLMLPFSSSSTPGIFLVPRSRGPTPDKNNKLPTRRACGYNPTGSGALDEFRRSFSSVAMLKVKNFYRLNQILLFALFLEPTIIKLCKK